jgi:hypothetical protein
VVQQFTSTSSSTTLFHGLKEPGFIFQHSVDCLLNDLSGIFADARGEFLDKRFYFRGKMDFHVRTFDPIRIAARARDI